MQCRCTDVIDNFYVDISSRYTKYIGKPLNVVVTDLKESHFVEIYRLKSLRNLDVVVWKSRRDNMAHVTIYNNNKFYYSSDNGVKEHLVLVHYKKMLKPMYIVRLKGEV